MRLWQYVNNGLPALQSAFWSAADLLQQPLKLQHQQPRIALSKSWQVLGPFSLGTREAPWGADPLELYGGFGNLSYKPDAWYRGSLVPGANVPWTVFNAQSFKNSYGSSRLTLDINFGEVDWSLMQTVYGWTALQYQAWARGYIDIGSEWAQNVVLYTDGILEFTIDEVPYFGGDFYSQRRAPTVLRLEPGRHQVDVRLIRDVRAMGGIGLANIQVGIEAKIAREPLEISHDGILVPDVIRGQFASKLGSVTLRNSGTTPLEIVQIEFSGKEIELKSHNVGLRLDPGQTRHFNFEISLTRSDVAELLFTIVYSKMGEPDFKFNLDVSHRLRQRDLYDPHLVTFSHRAGLVSYAVVRAPQRQASCPPYLTKAPIFLALHGAGVDANSDLVSHSFDSVKDVCAWLLFPTGTTTWSGDDWHNWGFADVEAAIHHLPDWQEHNEWTGIEADIERWFVSGHSNGGQGAWYTLLHRPDRVIGAAVVSGYSSIQTYVPYNLWQYADPRQVAVIQSALNSFRHELLLDNAKGIPVIQQHGSHDDNVPVYHARLMHQLLHEAGQESRYEEISKGHWFQGVMETLPLQEFYHSSLESEFRGQFDKLDAFTLTVADTGDMGSKGGVRVVHLVDPGQYGRIKVNLTSGGGQCHFSTSNVRAFELDSEALSCRAVTIDQQNLHPAQKLYIRHNQTWTGIDSPDEMYGSTIHRRPHQSGGMNAILNSEGRFRIIYDGKKLYRIALQISRNFMQYFAADSVLLRYGQAPTSKEAGHAVSLFVGSGIPKGAYPDFPLVVREDIITIRDDSGNLKTYTVEEDAVAVVCVRPLNGQKLEIVVWGQDLTALDQAARLVPTMTGVGQPDFVVLSRSSRWKGIGGVLAMGFFDHEWNVTRSSYLS